MEDKPEKIRKAKFSLVVSEQELDKLKNIAGWIKSSDNDDDQAFGERLRKCVHRTAKKMGFKYVHE